MKVLPALFVFFWCTVALADSAGLNGICGAVAHCAASPTAITREATAAEDAPVLEYGRDVQVQTRAPLTYAHHQDQALLARDADGVDYVLERMDPAALGFAAGSVFARTFAAALTLGPEALAARHELSADQLRRLYAFKRAERFGSGRFVRWRADANTWFCHRLPGDSDCYRVGADSVIRLSVRHGAQGELDIVRLIRE